MILWPIISLSIIHLTMQEQCPTKTCACETQGTKTESSITEAKCNDIPPVKLPTLKSLKVIKNMNTTTDEMLEHTPQLSSLDLSGCNITFISNRTFVNLAHLIHLQLSHNNLRILQPGVFHSMHTLQELYLDYNFLEEIHKDLFIRLVHLRVLSLAKNRLHSLPMWLPTSLLELNVSFNNIGPKVGQNSSQFQGKKFDLYGNPIDTIENWNWINTNKLHNLRTVLSTVATSENVIFNELTSLTLHSNRGSPLDGNTTQILKRMTNLKNLTLENFYVLRLDFLQSMANLKSLKLKQIHYSNSTFLREEFSLLQELRLLDLEESPRLAEIVLKHWQGIKFANLEHISFRNCEIKNITTDFSWYSGYGTIDLQGNPLDCTCSNNWIAHNLEIIQNSENTMCSSPEDMKNQSIMFICNDVKKELDYQIKINNTTSNNQTNEHQTYGSDSKNGIILFQLALIILVILAISLCIICLYMHHEKLEVHRLETQQPHVRLQEVQHEEDVESTQQLTKQ